MKKENNELVVLIIIFISSLIFLFSNLSEIKLFGLIVMILSFGGRGDNYSTFSPLR